METKTLKSNKYDRAIVELQKIIAELKHNLYLRDNEIEGLKLDIGVLKISRHEMHLAKGDRCSCICHWKTYCEKCVCNA